MTQASEGGALTLGGGHRVNGTTEAVAGRGEVVGIVDALDRHAGPACFLPIQEMSALTCICMQRSIHRQFILICTI